MWSSRARVWLRWKRPYSSVEPSSPSLVRPRVVTLASIFRLETQERPLPTTRVAVCKTARTLEIAGQSRTLGIKVINISYSPHMPQRRDLLWRNARRPTRLRGKRRLNREGSPLPWARKREGRCLPYFENNHCAQVLALHASNVFACACVEGHEKIKPTTEMLNALTFLAFIPMI